MRYILIGLLLFLFPMPALADKPVVFGPSDIKLLMKKMPKNLRIVPKKLPKDYKIYHFGWNTSPHREKPQTGYSIRYLQYREFEYKIPDTFLEKKLKKKLAKRTLVKTGASQSFEISIHAPWNALTKEDCLAKKGDVKVYKSKALGKGHFCFTPRTFSYNSPNDLKRTIFNPKFFKIVKGLLNLEGAIIQPLKQTRLTDKGIYISGSVVDEADFSHFYKSLKRLKKPKKPKKPKKRIKKTD